MNTRLLLASFLLVPSAAFAADPPAAPAEAKKVPAIPVGQLAKKTELLFSDDFEGATPDARWHKVVPTFAVEKGALKGTQTRDKSIPAADGKPAVTAHAAVHGLEVPTQDSVVEVRFRLDGATFVSVEFDDRKFTGAHYGHLCFARVTPTSVVLADQKDGSMRNDIYAMANDPARKAERAALLKGRQATFPATVSAGQWHDLAVETVGDEMLVRLDGKPVGYLKSSGIGHTTKSKIELGVGGKDGWFDDLKVWNATPAK